MMSRSKLQSLASRHGGWLARVLEYGLGGNTRAFLQCIPSSRKLPTVWETTVVLHMLVSGIGPSKNPGAPEHRAGERKVYGKNDAFSHRSIRKPLPDDHIVVIASNNYVRSDVHFTFTKQ
jgi:hypothetical protein